RLLTHVDTSSGSRGAVALSELLGVGEGLDRRAELLGGDEVEVLDVVRILRVRLGAGGRLGDGNKPVPSHTRVVVAGLIAKVEDAVVDTGLVESLANLVPSDSSHG